MDDVIDRVAAAICYATKAQCRDAQDAWETASDDVKKVHRWEARAAIEALRDPNEEMIEYGNHRMASVDCSALTIWRGMHDVLLNPLQEASSEA